MRARTRKPWTRILAAAIGALALPGVAAGDEIGVTSAVNTTTRGTPPAAPPRDLVLGTQVIRNERVSTDATGQAQLLFIDGTAMTIGPDAELVLDEFVFNPDADAGRMVVNASKGLMRVIGGRLSKKQPIEIRTPTATIGIRGGIVMLDIQSDGRLTADFLFGHELTVSSGGVTQTTRKPGNAIEIAAAGAPPSRPRPAPAQRLSGGLSRLEGKSTSEGAAKSPGAPPGGKGGGQTGAPPPNGSGGAPMPTDAAMARTNVSEAVGSNAPPAQIAPPPPPPSGPPPPPPVPQDAGAGKEVRDFGQTTAAPAPTPQPPEISVSDVTVDETAGTVTFTVTRTGDLSRASRVNYRTIGNSANAGSDFEPVRGALGFGVGEASRTITVALIDDDAIEGKEFFRLFLDPDTATNARLIKNTATAFIISDDVQAPTRVLYRYDGLALRSGTDPDSDGADVTVSEAALADRRFTNAEVSGIDVTSGGELTAQTRAGQYSLFFPGTGQTMPASLADCPAALPCVVHYPSRPPGTSQGTVLAGDDFVTYLIKAPNGAREMLFAGTPFTGSLPDTLYSYAVMTDGFLSGVVPWVRGRDFGQSSGTQAGTAWIHWGSTAADKPFLISRFALDDANGRSAGGVGIGRVIDSPDGPAIVGVGYGSVDPGGDGAPTLYSGGMFSADTGQGRDFFGRTGPRHFVLTAVPDRDWPGGTAGVAPVSGTPRYHPSNVATYAGSSAPGKRDAETLYGFVGGAGTSAKGSNAYTTDIGSDTQLPFAWPVRLLQFDRAGDKVADATLRFTNGGESDREAYTARIGSGQSAYIQDNRFAAELRQVRDASGKDSQSVGYVATGYDNTANFDLCGECRYLYWGFWSLRTQDANDLNLHMAAWVAGQPNFLSGGENGSATYSGNAIGSVVDGRRTYVKTDGRFSMDVDFSTTDYEISNFSFSFDGKSFAQPGSTAQSTPKGHNYTLSLSQGGRDLQARGAFFGPSGTRGIPPETAGDFRIRGNGYTAAGVFAGRGASRSTRAPK